MEKKILFVAMVYKPLRMIVNNWVQALMLITLYFFSRIGLEKSGSVSNITQGSELYTS